MYLFNRLKQHIEKIFKANNTKSIENVNSLLVPQIKVWTEFIIGTLSSKERLGNPFKSTSMFRKSAKSLS